MRAIWLFDLESLFDGGGTDESKQRHGPKTTAVCFRLTTHSRPNLDGSYEFNGLDRREGKN